MTKTNVKNVHKRHTSPFFNSTITYLIILLAFVAVRIFASFNLLEFLGDFENLVYSLIIQVGIIFGLTLVVFKHFSKKSTKQIFNEFQFKKISWKAVLLCIGIGICLIFINTAFNSFYSLILSLFGYAPATSTISSYSLPLFLLTIFASAVLPAFCEEFANRGMLLNGLKKLGIKKAVLISGLLFGLMHLNVGQFGYAFLIGIFFAFLFFATGSIIPGIILHFLNNAFTEYLTFAQVNNLPFGNVSSQINNLIAGGDFFSTILVIFLVIFTILFLFCWLTYLLIKETKMKEIKNLGQEIAENINTEDEESPRILKIDLPLNAIGFQFKQSYFPKLKEKIPMYSAIFLGTIITIMTLIWNTL